MLKMILTLMFQGVIPMYLGFGANPALAQFKAEQGAADTAAGQFGTGAASEGAMLNPFYAAMLKSQHSMTPTQMGEELTAADRGAGAAFGAAGAEEARNAARTGNATTLTADMQSLARDKAKSAAGASEGIAAQDVAGAQQQRMQGAQGLQGLYGTNVSGQLGAMKEATQDIQGEMAANPGWLKSTLGTVADLGNAAGSVMSGAGSMGAKF